MTLRRARIVSRVFGLAGQHHLQKQVRDIKNNDQDKKDEEKRKKRPNGKKDEKVKNKDAEKDTDKKQGRKDQQEKDVHEDKEKDKEHTQHEKHQQPAHPSKDDSSDRRSYQDPTAKEAASFLTANEAPPQAPASGDFDQAPSPVPPSYSSTETTQSPGLGAPSLTTQDSRAVTAAPHDSKPSMAVIAGATLGGILLLLAVITVIAYKCGLRQRAATKSKSDGRGAGPLGGFSTHRTNTSEKAEPSSFSILMDRGSGNASSLPSHSHAALHGESSFSSPIVQPRSPLRPRNSHEAHQERAGSATSQHGDESETLHDHEVGHSRSLLAVVSKEPQLAHEVRTFTSNEGEKTCEGDDTQIDRCLSYYMKRHTRISMPPPAIPEVPPLPSPHQDLDFVTDRSNRHSKASRKSFKFPKTSNLLEKIRRSQIRLDGEALAKARQEGYRVSNVFSHKARTSVQGRQLHSASPGSSDTTDMSRYDASNSFVFADKPPTQAERKLPAHWRSSTRLNRAAEASSGEDVLGSSPVVSEPHSAFEYAEYYDSYLPGPHASVQFQLTGDGVEDGFAFPWQNQSPCRSSALSPRLSSSVSMRQRSATFSQTPPSPWTSNANAEPSNDAGAGSQQLGKSYLSQVSNRGRESEEVDEVIRF